MENILKEKFKNELLLLYRESYFAKAQYILLEDLYHKILSDTKKNFKHLLSISFDAMEFSVLLKLTKIYDDDPDKQSITLKHILNKVQSCKELNNNKDEIKEYATNILKNLETNKFEINKIKTCRDKVVSHIDKKYPNGLLSLKTNEQIDFNILKKYSDYAYNTLKNIYEFVYNEVLLDTKQFEILKQECEYLKNNLLK